MDEKIRNKIENEIQVAEEDVRQIDRAISLLMNAQRYLDAVKIRLDGFLHLDPVEARSVKSIGMYPKESLEDINRFIFANILLNSQAKISEQSFINNRLKKLVSGLTKEPQVQDLYEEYFKKETKND